MVGKKGEVFGSFPNVAFEFCVIFGNIEIANGVMIFV